MSLRGEVGDDVSGVGRDRYLARKQGLLPAARRFAGEGHGAEQRSRAGPKMTHMRPAVSRASFVKPDAADKAVTVGTEFQSEFHGVRVVFEAIGRRRPAPPYTARTRYRGRDDSDGNFRRRILRISAVVDCATSDRHRSG